MKRLRLHVGLFLRYREEVGCIACWIGVVAMEIGGRLYHLRCVYEITTQCNGWRGWIHRLLGCDKASSQWMVGGEDGCIDHVTDEIMMYVI